MYALYICSSIAIEITTNNYIHSVSRLSDCANKVVSFLDNGFHQPIFNSLREGSFYHLAGFGDIPFSHGDIPVVSYQLYEVEQTKTYFSTWSFFLGSFAFLPMGAFYCLLQVSKDARFFLVRSIRSDSLLMRKHNPSGVFVEAIILISIYTAVFHFQLFQNSLNSQRTNTIGDISNWSVRIQR